MISFDDAQKKLSEIGQEPILQNWDALSDDQKQSLLLQIDSLDIPLFKQQQADGMHSDDKDYTPLDIVSEYGDADAASIGRQAIQDGLVATIVVAGGQGTRLGFLHPKGMYPITKIKHKSLFQLVVEKALACGKRAEKNLFLAFMTSQENDSETRQYFKDHHFFGANKKQIGFFSQGNLPFLNTENNLFLEDGKIVEGPDGNGAVFSAFLKSPLFEQWKKAGVRIILFTLIDNPLADPFDEELIGRLIRGQRPVVIKAIERIDPDEKVGVLVQNEGVISVIEYTEFPRSKMHLRKDDGSLLYNAANISLFCMDLNFFERIGKERLPLHKAFKNNAWKFERFIFDMLPFARHVETVIYPRNVCFSPLKNKEGKESPAEVQKALVARDRAVLGELIQDTPPLEIEEIAQEYYYPTETLKKRLKDDLPRTSYLGVGE